jgi:hypothetical protein
MHILSIVTSPRKEQSASRALRAKVDGPNEAPMTRNVRGQGFILSAAPALPKCLRGLQGVEQRELAQTNSNNV